MRSITTILSEIKTELVKVTANCYHYRRPVNGAKSGYIVWQEDSEEGSLETDNIKTEQQLHGTVDYFTLTEFDTTIDSIQSALNGIMCGWRLLAVDYEDETNLIHYEWEFWVA